ncbi:hypothetical protein [Halomonas cupida]|nr:hypothetical protein [Halomonas cupida]
MKHGRAAVGHQDDNQIDQDALFDCHVNRDVDIHRAVYCVRELPACPET